MHFGKCQFDYLAKYAIWRVPIDYLPKYAFWHVPIWLFNKICMICTKNAVKSFVFIFLQKKTPYKKEKKKKMTVILHKQ